LCSSKAENLKATQIEKQRREKSFGAEAIAAWKYPLRGDGLVILIAGTIFLALSNIFQRVTFLFSGLAFVATTGYLLAYSQKIITSTANGEDDPPTWPDLSDFSQDILTPFFQAIGMFVLYLLPWFCSLWLLPAGEPVQWIVSGLLLLLALFLMPMAWLAVSMHDTIGALSPHLVFPSILRIPLSYLAVSLELIVLIAVNTAVSWGLDQLNIPVVPWLAGSFLGLYFFMVIARLLGVLYYTNREKLGWF
jgi:hypothetical protein